MSDEEWGPWVEHDGNGCPCVGMYVHMVLDGISKIDINTRTQHINGGRELVGIASGGRSWFWDKSLRKIIRYRVRKPKGLKMVEELIQNLPAPTKEMEKT
jgi:hypothetical protein